MAVPEPPVDVLVVGAGPTGLALATQARAHGATVRIIDRNADRARESRALAVQARTLEVLTGPGIAATLVNAATRACGCGCMPGGGRCACRCSTWAWRTRTTRSCCSCRKRSPSRCSWTTWRATASRSSGR